MDFHRPTYHFLPEKNWMNDPNGVCYFQGYYHLFYQYNPNGSQWGDIHWGHAKSKDLVHWEQLPLALSPSTEKGELHCFSGCAVVSEEIPYLFYTSVGEGKRDAYQGAEQWMATGDSKFLTFEKLEQPILTKEDHRGLEVTDWRDPFVVKHNGRFYMVLGATAANHGCALLYESEDLLHWTYKKILAEGRPDEKIWECPNLLFFGDICILVISPGDTPRYIMGKIDADFNFHPLKEGMLDYCGMEGFYAPNSFVDHLGRTIMIGWLTDNSRKEYKKDANWSGTQSIPRVLSVENETLFMRPIPELETLRGSLEQQTNVKLEEHNMLTLNSESQSFELNLDGTFETDGSLTIELLKSEQEKTVLFYQQSTKSLTIDRSLSSSSSLPSKTSFVCPDTHSEDGKLHLQIFVDHSVLEVFINEREVMTARIYPECPDSMQICLSGSKGLLQNLKVWEMKQI